MKRWTHAELCGEAARGLTAFGINGGANGQPGALSASSVAGSSLELPQYESISMPRQPRRCVCAGFSAHDAAVGRASSGDFFSRQFRATA
jgi:hypothetical protein